MRALPPVLWRKLIYGALSLAKTSLICLLSYILSLFIPRSGVFYVLGSNYGGKPDPNIQSLAKYLVDQGKTVYFIGEAFPSDGSGFVLERGSFKATLYFFMAQGGFYTHSFSDLIPYAHRLGWLRYVVRFPPLIFLQHGVIGLKSKLSNGISMADYLGSLEPTFDRMIVSSDYEKQLVLNMGIRESKLRGCGLARFDRYYEGLPAEKHVLVFFTWQDQSDLMAKMEAVRCSGAINLLEVNGYQISFALHPMQRVKHDDEFDSEIKFDVQKSALLITDDSSIAWDFLFLGREVIFFQPSNDWLTDLEALLVRRCYTISELNTLIERFLSQGSLGQKVNFDGVRDGQNCARTLSLVSEINKEREC